MFTGRWPHELSTGWLTPLDATHPTLAEYLSARGYGTAGFIANTIYCSTDSGLARGFARYRDYIFPQLSAFKMAALIDRPLSGIRTLNGFLRAKLHLVPFKDLLTSFDAGDRKPANVVAGEFLDWLSRRRQPERPFFAFLNFYDVHCPYQVREGAKHRFGSKPRTDREMDLIDGWATMDKLDVSVREIAFVRDSYDDCVADLDEQLGRLIDALQRQGTLNRTWVIIASDHGESFGEHTGEFGHGTTLYQTQVHVPLLILPPGGERCERLVHETVSLRDLPATVVNLLGLEDGAPFPGESLARCWKQPRSPGSGAPVSSGPALSEVVPTDPLDPDPARMLKSRQVWASVAEGHWVYIRRGTSALEELFDLRDDPKELHNLSGDPAQQSVLMRMRDALDELTAGPLTPRRFNP
jgi:arylsulfatase A-like enzyme